MGNNYSLQINRQQQARNSLIQNNNSLRNFINEISGKKRQLEQRLRQVEGIKHAVERGLDGDSNDVSSKQHALVSDIENAIKMQGFTEETINSITREYEPALSNDSDGASMVSQLNAEIRRIQNELEDANHSIDEASRRIDANNRSIQTANNNIRNLQRAQQQAQG